MEGQCCSEPLALERSRRSLHAAWDAVAGRAAKPGPLDFGRFSSVRARPVPAVVLGRAFARSRPWLHGGAALPCRSARHDAVGLPARGDTSVEEEDGRVGSAGWDQLRISRSSPCPWLGGGARQISLKLPPSLSARCESDAASPGHEPPCRTVDVGWMPPSRERRRVASASPGAAHVLGGGGGECSCRSCKRVTSACAASTCSLIAATSASASSHFAVAASTAAAAAA